MKKIVFTTIVILIFLSCSRFDNEYYAKVLIMGYYGDGKEPDAELDKIEYGELEKVYFDKLCESVYLQMEKAEVLISGAKNELEKSNCTGNEEERKKALESFETKLKEAAVILENYNSGIDKYAEGYSMVVSFNIHDKNAVSESSKMKKTFYFDKDVRNILFIE